MSVEQKTENCECPIVSEITLTRPHFTFHIVVEQ